MSVREQRITFVSHTNKPGGGELALRRYLEVTQLPVRLVTLETGGVWDGLDREVIHASGVRGLRKVLREGGLVVANSMRAAFLAALVAPRRTLLVYWVRDGLTHSAMSPVALALTKYVTARRARHYIANSQWTAGTVREAMNVGLDQVDVAYSMCGVTEAMLDQPPRTEPYTPLRLLYLGRLSPWKGPDVAVRALAELRELGVRATLTIAGEALFGENAYVEELHAVVEAEPAATLVGHVEGVRQLLANHDVLVHCSTTPEPFGQVIIQALAQGMPVVATAHGGPLEILRASPVRLLYTAGDPHELADAIHGVVPHLEEVARWGRLRAEDFLDEVVCAQTDQILGRLRAT